MKSKILLIGCGNLGRALLNIWIHCEDLAGLGQIIVVQPSLGAQSLFSNFSNVTFIRSREELPASYEPDVVVIAIKPQKVPTVLPDYAELLNRAMVISLCAGISIKTLKSYLGNNEKIVRLMPSVAMSVGMSVNLVSFNEKLRLIKRKPLEVQMEALFQHTGKLIFLEKEELIDLLTPISGSGPAYFYLMAEILTQITVSLGVELSQARKIVQQTFLGSALLANQQSETSDFNKLISSVASKGGVTEAALAVLTPELMDLMKRACVEAFNRLKELSQ